ncbi:imidazolonepropionase [Prolixibacter denitrificans]|uniref:Imidazolonepropionase n=1 Tax=Prolixibacter denitrificans TaxID=1541063 RepID=A0A2P8CBP2_9BACT|nr:imidazolonepropionase [Prolixibacter denitrificans]PSK82381.1 imidazolonepropionase [Prolixibacter denitrificans]GET22873.1 imidazolonepropionase [Prolixibacter denitrificans]
MKILLVNIKELVQVEEEPKLWVAGKDMAKIHTVKDAFLLMRDEMIVDFGPMDELNKRDLDNYDVLMEIDCSGRMVFPSFCDSHTHLVYPASREQEFVDKINGLSYEEIARRGGGILNSARRLHEMSEEELCASALERISEIIYKGTGAVEIKSGYGLNPEDEIKMLRVIRRLKESTPLAIKSTFLGAHSIPIEYRDNPSVYVDQIINDMLPRIAEEELADYIDVFCDTGFFTVADTERILEAGAEYGLLPKIHANELGLTGGVQVGVKNKALSVDHLEYLGDDEINVLKHSHTMPTILPGAAFFLDLPLSPARKLIDSGLPVALATDFNPGSSPSGDMKFMQSLGCIRYKMLPEEVINATTINSAYAMGISDGYGSIARGKAANVFITREIPSYQYFPYAYNSELIETVILRGEIQ